MEKKELQSWDDFEKEVVELVELRKQRSEGAAAPIFFRGHSDASWPLETTLERCLGNEEKLINYFRLIYRVKNRIETFTDRR
jgi:hypothetical protein